LASFAAHCSANRVGVFLYLNHIPVLVFDTKNLIQLVGGPSTGAALPAMSGWVVPVAAAAGFLEQG
jgi:hypothetical protein